MRSTPGRPRRRGSGPPAGRPVGSRRTVRSPLVFIGAAAALLAIAWAWWLRGPTPFAIDVNADRNVLLITIDTLRADAIGAYGGRARTPHLDRLAARGARFDFAHAHAVVTLPSHASILTGQLPYEHGIRDNSGYRLKDGTATLATRLKALGFRTAAFVGGFPLTKRFGLTPGFDVYDDQISELQGDAALTVPERPANAVVSRAIEWIGGPDGGAPKFFSWVHLFDPHWPYAPPERFRAAYSDRPYDGEVAWVDEALGVLFDRLETLSRPTVVVVTSDHGESLGEHGEATHGMFAYEATLRVPLIVVLVTPHQTPRGGVTIDTPVRHIDIAPTVLDAIGAPLDPAWLGTSLRDVMRDGRGADRPSYFESMTHNLVRGWAPLRGVVVDRNKYIDQPVPELYDLRADAGELRNLASSDPARRQVLDAVLRSYNVAPPARPGRETASVAATLRSLGYLSSSAPNRTIFTEADDLKNMVAIDRDLQKAEELLQRGDVAEAVRLLEDVIAGRSDVADAYVTLARAYWTTGDQGRAIATLDRALAAGATHSMVRIRLGLYLAESRIDAARAIVLLRDLPQDDAEATNALGIAFSAAGRFADAVAAFERVVTLDPTNGLAMQNIAAIRLQQNALPDAERFARQAVIHDPLLAKAHTTLGVVLARTGRKPEAIESWKRALTLDRTEFDALYNLIVLLVEAQRTDEARGYAKQFVSSAPPALYRAEIQQLRPLAGNGGR